MNGTLVNTTTSNNDQIFNTRNSQSILYQNNTLYDNNKLKKSNNTHNQFGYQTNSNF